MRQFVFFGFCYSDIAARPWLEAGYNVVICDIQHAPGAVFQGGHVGGQLTRLGCDLANSKAVLGWLDVLSLTECVFAGFFPPCTHIASSGARWWKQKGLRALQESISYFATSQELAEHFGCPYFIENPVSAIATHWRKPDYICDPCDFTALAAHDNYTKKTCLWTGGGFQMPEAARADGLPAPDERIWRSPQSKQRARLRSMTPEGFARAVFLANAS